MYTIREFAKIKGVSTQNIYKSIKEGKVLNKYVVKENGITYISDDAMHIDDDKERETNEQIYDVSELKNEIAKMQKINDDLMKKNDDLQSHNMELQSQVINMSNELINIAKDAIRINENYQLLENQKLQLETYINLPFYKKMMYKIKNK